MEIKINASLMCCDPMNMHNEVRELQAAGCDSFHVDIIDGRFANNLLMNFDEVVKIRNISTIPIDVHLMVEKPENYLDILQQAHVDTIMPHIEACKNIKNILQRITALGIKAGIAISPETHYFPDLNVLKYLNTILVMSVNPGFKGQKFISSTISKVANIKNHLNNLGYGHIEIQVDGSISSTTIPPLFKVGATAFVGGTAGLFCDGRYKENMISLRNSIISKDLSQFRQSGTKNLTRISSFYKG